MSRRRNSERFAADPCLGAFAMFGSHIEIRDSSSWRRVYLVPRIAVSEDASGRFAVRLGGLRGGGTQLIPWHAVRRPSREEVSRLLRTSFGTGGCSGSDIAWRLGLAADDEQRVIEHVVALLVGGSYLLVEIESEAVSLGHSTTQATPRESQPAPRVSLGPQHETRLQVRIVLDDGAALAGAAVTLRGPNGRTAELLSSRSGEARLDGLPADGVGEAVVRPGETPRTLPGAATVLHADHVFDFPFGAAVEAAVLTGATRTILLRRPEVERVDTSNLGFAPDSALLVALGELRSPVQGLATAMARLQLGPACRLLVVGHASPDGDLDANELLALRRAECVRHLLVGDRDAWVDLAAHHGSPADVQRLLRYLARAHDWPTEPTRVDGVVDDAVANALASFQAHYNAVFAADLTVDGVCGEQTLGALFEVQRQELRLQLAAVEVPNDPPKWFTSKGVISAGARVLGHPAIPGSWSAKGQRRVDLLLIPDDITWRESHGIVEIYDVARLRLLPMSPLAVGPCDLIVQVVDHYGRPLANEPYRLVTDDETREGTSDDQGMVFERDLRGRSPRLTCGDAVIIIDDPYLQMTRARYERTPAFQAGQDEPEDDVDWDRPLPAPNDEDAANDNDALNYIDVLDNDEQGE